MYETPDLKVFFRVILATGFLFLQQGEASAQCVTDTATSSGEATYYYATGEGSCMFDATPQDLMVAAMNASEYDVAGVCGECVELTGPDASVTVRIVDRCPGCQTGDIDLSREAFAMIADTGLGRVPVSWRVVPCDVSGPIEYHFKNGSSQWWTAVQIRNHRHPIASVEYVTSGGAFKTINRVNYNYFVESGGMGPGPYIFRITDIYGHVMIDSGIAHVEDGTVAGQDQFPPCDNTATGINTDGQLPAGFWLSPNYPNPWNPMTTIRYTLPLAEHVILAVYNAAGREIALLVDEHQHAGEHKAMLRADGLASGVYYYTLRAGEFEQTRKLMLLK